MKRSQSKRLGWIRGGLALASVASVVETTRVSAEEEPIPSLEEFSLDHVEPIVNKAGGLIRNQKYAEILGKAFFWDIAVGSDGQACASCHFSGGADIRLENQVSPGNNGFDYTKAGGMTGPNKVLSAREWPFFQLEDILDRHSKVLHDKNDRFSSQGTFGGQFQGSKRRKDLCINTFDADQPAHASGYIFRRVEPRNTPTNINAVFFQRLFWDGRANNIFNGQDPFGRRSLKSESDTGIFVLNSSELELEKLELPDSSLASQALAPPLSDQETSCAGRRWEDIARKLLERRPLRHQKIHRNDSLLGSKSLRHESGRGLGVKYKELIKKAFKKKYWKHPGRFSVGKDGSLHKDNNGLTQFEHNFSMFFGVAVQAYQALLISDEAPIDKDQYKLRDEAIRGFGLFVGKGKCVNCHEGPLFSGAARPPRQLEQVVENMPMATEATALYDGGFYNIGVTPTVEDRGVGGKDPFGNPLSHTRQWVAWHKQHREPSDPEVKKVKDLDFESPLSHNPGYRDAVDGAFKTPTLRNVGLTPPYFHDGSAATLKQVVQFYNRGGNRQGQGGHDTTGLESNGSNLDAGIEVLGLTAREVNDVVAFLLALTDERVACHQEIFDHPSLPLTRGHKASARADGTAKDRISVLPAVGRRGLPGIGKPCFANTGRLFGKMQQRFNRITHFDPGYKAKDIPDPDVGFAEPEPEVEPELEPKDTDDDPEPPKDEQTWTRCAAEGQLCRLPRARKYYRVRMTKGEVYEEKKSKHVVFCVARNFGFSWSLKFWRHNPPWKKENQGYCEYREY